ncbi:MAG: murein biosynthesis integral membrane protein MurJ [Alphaproteobacteria bacterium]
MTFLRSVATVGGYTMVSRVLGFVRDILIAAFLGAGPVADAFFVAFRIPNLFRRLVAEGAFAAAFVPLFSRHLEREGQSAARAFAEEALAVLLSTLLLFTILVEISMPWLMHVIAPGFGDEPDLFALAVRFTRRTFTYLLFMALVALLGGVLNSLYRFAAPAAAPILLNVVLIAALLGAAERGQTAVGHALAWGVAAAGAGQFLWLVVACRRAGVSLSLPRPHFTPDVRRLLRLMLPAAFAGGVMQINLVIGTAIASLLPTGAISYLYYADRVYQLPLGVVGIAVGTALLPNLARKLRSGGPKSAMDTHARALEISLLLTLPAAAALMTIPSPIITVLFERGAFDAVASQATAAALIAFAFGLPAYVLVRVLSPGFFAREDTVTPLRIAVLAVVANVLLSLALFRPLGHVGIALATALSAWLNAALLWRILKKRGFLEIDDRLKTRLPRMVMASAAMAGLLALGAWALAAPLAGSLPLRIAALAFLVAGGVAVFAVLAQALGAANLGELRRMMRKDTA